jgi:5-methyltetrahydropteroyltriglutamate--homocysteine methyltransferase
MLGRSFVRTDIPPREVANQIALAISTEVELLEASGISVIQVDEPALREGAPLKGRDWDEYLAWGVDAFKLCTSVVKDTTQIHTHISCCDFHEILDSVRAMDADVISLETSRSHGTFIGSLRKEPYKGGIGLGVYDIHSPFIPAVTDMERIIRQSLEAVPAERLWINPGCGLKTLSAAETVESLRRMVEAARRMRQAEQSVHTSA